MVVKTSQIPNIAVSVDGAKPTIIKLTNGSTKLFDNLSATNHKVVVWIDGLYEGDWFWTDPNYGIFIRNITTPNNTYIRKPSDKRKSILIIGDSITEGVNIHGTDGNPDSNSGYNSYSNFMARILNMRPLVHGFGGTGLSVGGSGQVPKYLSSITNYSKDKRVFNETIPDVIVINGGTNDAGNNIPNATFVADYQALINNQRNKYPAAKIILLVPFNGACRLSILALGSSNGLPVIDMSIFSGITTSDGTHPNLSGHSKLAEQLALLLKPLIQ